MQQINLVTLIDDDKSENAISINAIEKSHLAKAIKVFYNGKEAIDYLIENAVRPSSLPDIILLDLKMPVMDGFEFLEEFSKIKPLLNKKIHIYILSTTLSLMDFNRVNKMNEVLGYIIKPITEQKFKNIVQAIKD